MPLFATKIPAGSRIACIPTPRLGDALFMMVTACNLRKAGYRVTVFSDYIEQLHAWFPNDEVRAAAGWPEVAQAVQGFDVVLHKYRDTLTAQEHKCERVLADSPLFKAKMSMADIHRRIGREELHLPEARRVNDLVIPAGVAPRKFAQRVVIHPTSFVPHKNWTAKKFVALAHRMMRAGFEPAMVMAPDERPAWEWVRKEGIALPRFADLNETARWICESGYFVGVDSGIGHLASNVGVPTVSLFLRKGTSVQWHPTWADHRVVLPPGWLVARPIKERFWRYAVSVERVWGAFVDLAVFRA